MSDAKDTATDVAVPLSAGDTVQAAINSHVAEYQTALESKIKAQLGDVHAAVQGGFKEIAADVGNLVRGRPVQIQDSTGAEHTIPRWLVWTGFFLANVAVVAIGDWALHSIGLLH